MKNEAKWTNILLICKEDQNCKQQFRDILVKELPIEKASFLKAAGKVDYDQMAQLVHKIKHKFSLLKMESAYQFSNSYEDELNNSIDNSSSTFIKYIDQLLEFLDISDK